MYVSYSFVCVQVIDTGNIKQQQGNPDGVCLFTLPSSFLSSVVSYLSLYIQLLLLLFVFITLHTNKYMLYCGLNMYSIVCLFGIRTIAKDRWSSRPDSLMKVPSVHIVVFSFPLVSL